MQKKYKSPPLFSLATTITIWVLGLFLVIVLSLTIWLHTKQSEEYLSSLISKIITNNSGYNVKIQGFKPTLPFNIYVRSLELTDSKGVWLTVKGIEVDLNLSLLLKKHLSLNELSAEDITVVRFPILSSSTSFSSPNDNMSPAAYRNLIDITINRLDISHLNIQNAGLELALNGKLLWHKALKELTLNMKSIKYNEHQIADLSCHTTAENNANQWLGKIIVQGASVPLAISSDFILDNNNLIHLSNINGASAKSLITGDLVVNTNYGTVNGIIHLNSELAEITDSLKGSLEMLVKLSATENNQQLAVEASAKKFFSLYGSIAEIKLTTKSNNLKKLKIDSIIFDLKNFQHPESSRASPSLNLHTSASLSLDNPDLFRLAANIQGNYGKDKIITTKPIIIELKEQKLLWDIKQLLIGSGTFNSSGYLQNFLAKSAADKLISANLTSNCPIDLFTNWYFTPLHEFKGSLSTKASLTGNVERPVLNGYLNVQHGGYAYPKLGIKLKDINGTIKALDKKLSFTHWQAVDSRGKTLTASGQIILTPLLPFTFSLITEGFHLLNHPNVGGNIKGNLTITGTAKETKISGDIKAGPLEIVLPEHLSKTIPELNVVEAVPPQGSEMAMPSTYPVNLEVNVTAKHQVFVRGRGVNAGLEGNLKLRGSTESPMLKGKLQTMHGRYQEFGKQFSIKEGVLLFEGDIPPSPYITIKGVTKAGDIEIRPVLSGPLLSPVLSVESTPYLPQEEALSILLFGKAAKNIGPFQAIQLANSLRRLSGRGGNFDALANTRKLLNVDDITLKTSENNPSDTAVGIGKHISDSVYFELEKGTQAGTGKTKIEIELTPNISIESSVSETGTNSVGINWKRSY